MLIMNPSLTLLMQIPAKERMKSPAFFAANVAICAALYAIVIGVTAFIPTPWGVGQVLPGVVVPALFAIAMGPWVGGLGAAIGTFVGDMAFQSLIHTNIVLILVAGVPGNFFGFFVLGYLLKGKKNWSRFTVVTLISLFIGNLIAASGVDVVVFGRLSSGVQLLLVMGYTFFWIDTMVPFMFTILPLMMKGVSASPAWKRWFGEETVWGRESLARVFLSGVISSVPLFLLFLLTLVPAFGQITGAPVILGALPTVILVRYLILIGAVLMLFAPLAPILGAQKKV